MRIIKKYPNRRLYDTELGTYITLEDVKKLVLKRIDFQVIDAQTNKDLTQTTLLQIIADQETTATPLFTISILQDLIRTYHEKSHHTFSQYLEQALDLFIHQRDFLQNQWLAYQRLLTDPSLMQHAIEAQKKSSAKTTNKAKTNPKKGHKQI